MLDICWICVGYCFPNSGKLYISLKDIYQVRGIPVCPWSTRGTTAARNEDVLAEEERWMLMAPWLREKMAMQLQVQVMP